MHRTKINKWTCPHIQKVDMSTYQKSMDPVKCFEKCSVVDIFGIDSSGLKENILNANYMILGS